MIRATLYAFVLGVAAYTVWGPYVALVVASATLAGAWVGWTARGERGVA